MREILLTRGCCAVVDDADFERVSAMPWYTTHQGYAAHKKKGGRLTFLHRFVLGYDGPLTVDHINHDKRDNRRDNLRVVPKWINNLNREKEAVGVYLNRTGTGWEAKVSVGKRSVSLGTFASKELAQAVRASYLRDMQADPERFYKVPPRRVGPSGVRGVSFASRMNRWRAKISSTHLGYFRTKEEAVQARLSAQRGPNWGDLHTI